MKLKNLFLAAAVLSVSAACSTVADTKKEGCCPVKKEKSVCAKKALTFNNADFYKDGKFNEDAAKDAVIKLMKFYNFPVTATTRSQLWVSDYGTGKYTEVGLAAIMIENNVQDRYMLQALFLLPNQMLPEHWHEKPKSDLPAKMEGWFVHNGSTYTVGEGENNLAQFPEIKIPASHPNEVVAKNVTKVAAGGYSKLTKRYAHHWQFAGPEGAILYEVANVHDNESVRHLVPSIDKHFSGK